MIRPSTPPQAPQQIAGATIISGPWPSYVAFRCFPEPERWTLYELAKAGRLAMESRGFAMCEPYDAFVRRVTEELEL